MKENETNDIKQESKDAKMENMEKKSSDNKKKIIPSYQRKNEPVDKKAKKKSDKKLVKSRITIAIIVVAVLLVGLAVYGIISLINYNKYKPYKGFEETMKTYGFDKVYNNESAKTGESVTKSEAIKMVLSCVFNTSDISGFAKEPEGDDNYENAIWVEYAKFRGIITDSDINKDNAKDKATYIEVIRYLANAKTKILEKELDSAIDMKVKDLDSYKSDEQVAIEDMIANEIITINTKKINGQKHIFKGQMNELIVNFVQKYNTITVNGEKLNINEDKMPSNKDQYPYTLASVDKSVYEIENYTSDTPIGDIQNAKEVFSDRKEYYSQIDEKITSYLNTILNIDYNTIDYDTFKEAIDRVTAYSIDENDINEYINYVKNNKIQIVGNGKVQFPAIYYDGMRYRVRTKIEYTIQSSNTNINLLFGDLMKYYDEEDIVYQLGNSVIITDIPLVRAVTNNLLYIKILPLHYSITGNIK